jgi:hypothetical protein
VILGGSPAFHVALLQFTNNLAGRHRNYAGFTLHSNPHATHGDLLRFFDAAQPAAILDKTPPYEPDFLGRFVPEVVEQLSRDEEYHRLDVPFSQPDGSRFTLFVPVRSQAEISEHRSPQRASPAPAEVIFPAAMPCLPSHSNSKRGAEHFQIPANLAGAVARIGFGIYDARHGTTPLAVRGGKTDWDGHRAIVEFPPGLTERSSAQ